MWLRLLEVKRYAYLNDLLVAEDSASEVTQSVAMTIQVLVQAGFVVDHVYIGARFRTDQGRLYLLETRIQALDSLCNSFLQSRGRVYKPAHRLLSLLGLMAATLQPV